MNSVSVVSLLGLYPYIFFSQIQGKMHRLLMTVHAVEILDETPINTFSTISKIFLMLISLSESQHY